MCLAVPGKVLDVHGETDSLSPSRLATVDFQGSRVRASLMLTPDARPGDWVLVHAGFAIRTLPEAEALETWKYLQPEELEDTKMGKEQCP